MAQIRSKQIADFLSTVNWGTVKTSDIANASAIKSYVDAAISTEHLHHTEEAASLEALVSTEIDGALADVTSLETRVSLEENRVDAILLAADADKDSFAEIVSLINAVDTVNDDALATVIGNLNAEISSTNADVISIDARALAAEQALAAEIAATNGDVTSLEGLVSTEISDMTVYVDGEVASLDAALAAEIAATNTDVNSIDARLGAVSGDLVDSVDSLELALSAEISATNADFISIENALSAEISATNADVTSIDTRALALETALSAEIAATNADVTSLEGLVSTEISDMTVYVDGEVAGVAAGLAAEISATNADVTSIDARVTAEEARMDAVLLAATADKDSFAEIVSLINAVDTVNDDALATVILNLNAEISSTNADVISIDTRALALETALSAEISATNVDVNSIDARLGAVSGDLIDSVDSLELALSAEISATNADFISIENALSAEISATNADVTSLETLVSSEISDMTVYVDGEVSSLETALSAEISATNADVTSLATVDAGLDSRIATLEGTIMEDSEQAVEVFAGAGLAYTLLNPVQDDNANLVDVYVNGQRVLVEGVAGVAINLSNPGYVIDGDDQVVIVYQY